MRVDRSYLERAAAETGFQAEALEKALHLFELLESLRSHPYLGDRLALKGGTALNLFVLALPRLSVDVDLNVIAVADPSRETMLAERPLVEKAVQDVCARQSLTVRRVPEDPAGGKWRLGYERAAGGTGTIELDLNFLLRTPFWPVVRRDSVTLAGAAALGVPLLDEHELAGGKLAALFARNASRDLFDVHGLLQRGGLDTPRLRLAFVLYGAMNRRDWRTVTLDEVRMDPKDADRRLLPLLRAEVAPARGDVEHWCARMVSDCKEWLGQLLPFTAAEREFLERLNGRGEIAPEVLTDDTGLRARIGSHPAILWKADNVRKFRGGKASGGTIK